LSRRPRLADWGEYAASVYEVMVWGAEQFLNDWDEVVRVQNQATLDGSPVAQAVLKFMEDKTEHTASASELHKKLEGVAESLGVSIVRDKAWPKSARWLWKRIKEVLPLLVDAGIEATREHTDKGTAIALRKVPRNDVSNVREDESREDKAKTADINDTLMSETVLMSGLMSARILLTKRVLTLLTTLTLEMGILRSLSIPRSILRIASARSVCRHETRTPPTHKVRVGGYHVEEAGSSSVGEGSRKWGGWTQ
jgi:hypothetical protein